MATATKTVTELPAWKALSAHFQKIDRLHLRELFAQDPKRGERLTVEAAGLYLDYSKNRITEETLALLLQLAEQSPRVSRTRWGGYCGQSGWTLSNFHLLLSFSMPIPILTARPASCST